MSVGAGAVIENAVLDAGAEVPAGAVVRSPAEHAAVIWKNTYASEKPAKPAGKAKGHLLV